VKRITTPITETTIRGLKVGDEVLLSGRVVLSRDIGHKFMVETKPEWLRPLLEEAVIYHCGPVVARHEDGHWSFVAAGPTTSIREEPYQADVLETYKVRGVIGKGGMGRKTSDALGKVGACYFHATGGAGGFPPGGHHGQPRRQPARRGGPDQPGAGPGADGAKIDS
jgi:fumarate hydratase class I